MLKKICLKIMILLGSIVHANNNNSFYKDVLVPSFQTALVSGTGLMPLLPLFEEKNWLQTNVGKTGHTLDVIKSMYQTPHQFIKDYLNYNKHVLNSPSVFIATGSAIGIQTFCETTSRFFGTSQLTGCAIAASASAPCLVAMNGAFSKNNTAVLALKQMTRLQFALTASREFVIYSAISLSRSQNNNQQSASIESSFYDRSTSSFLKGFSCGVISHPMDTLLTWSQNNREASLSEMIKRHGPMPLFRGSIHRGVGIGLFIIELGEIVRLLPQ